MIEALLLYAVALGLCAGALHLAARRWPFDAGRATWVAAAVLGVPTVAWIGRYLRQLGRTARAWRDTSRR